MFARMAPGPTVDGYAEYTRLAVARLAEKTAAILAATNSPDALRMYVTACDFLDAVYVITESLRSHYPSSRTFYSDLRATESGRCVLGLRYLRGPSVHQAVIAQDFTGEISEVFYDHYGMWAWVRGASSTNASQTNHTDYEETVAGREIFLVVTEAYACLRALLANSAVDLPDVKELMSTKQR